MLSIITFHDSYIAPIYYSIKNSRLYNNKNIEDQKRDILYPFAQYILSTIKSRLKKYKFEIRFWKKFERREQEARNDIKINRPSKNNDNLIADNWLLTNTYWQRIK